MPGSTQAMPRAFSAPHRYTTFSMTTCQCKPQRGVSRVLISRPNTIASLSGKTAQFARSWHHAVGLPPGTRPCCRGCCRGTRVSLRCSKWRTSFHPAGVQDWGRKSEGWINATARDRTRKASGVKRHSRCICLYAWRTGEPSIASARHVGAERAMRIAQWGRINHDARPRSADRR